MEHFDLVMADQTQQSVQGAEIESLQVQPFNFQPCRLVHRERFWPRRRLEQRQEKPPLLPECTRKGEDLFL